MWKHKLVSHPEEEVTFTMKVIKKHKSAFERQVQEAILIELNQVDGNILNSKSGYNRCLIPRMTIMMGDRVVEDKPDSKEAAEDEEWPHRAVEADHGCAGDVVTTTGSGPLAH